MSVAQLTLDGGEVPLKRVAAERRLTDRHRRVLRHIVAHGAIRTYEAGHVVHSERGYCFHGSYYPTRRDVLQCCPFGCADGFTLMRQLEKAGIVMHLKRGLWVLP